MIQLNGKEVKFGRFPNGECNLAIDGLAPAIGSTITWLYEDDAEFFKLALLKGYLDRLYLDVTLRIQYMPHSRMDRVNNDYVMSLATSSKLVNDMGFMRVLITEPHSDVTPALVNNSTSIALCQDSLASLIASAAIESLFFPDAGAAKRYSESMPYAVGFKKREFSTGRIVDFSLTGDVLGDVLIVDDLCSKGGTFVHSAMLLKKHGAKRVSLLVANCERTVLTGELFAHIDMLYVPGCHEFLSNNKQVKFI